MSEQIKKSAYMAGNWWACRLHEKYKNRQVEFAEEVTRLIELEMLGEITWQYEKFDLTCKDGSVIKNCGRMVKVKGGGKDWTENPECWTEFDYDPCPLLEDAINTVFPDLSSWDMKLILPRKHSLKIYTDKLRPKEGYGNSVDDISVT